MSSSTATSSGRYIPPHLRNKPTTTASASTTPSAGPSRTSSPPRRPSDRPQTTQSAPSRSHSRTPWSNIPSSSSRESGNTNTDQNSREHSSDRREAQQSSSQSAPSRRVPVATAPTLHVFGDSFVGPLKLLEEDCVRVTTFKGSSAKGLNNPNSIKQVAKELVPAVNSLLAPPPYVYVPSAGRWALLVFGNVDLQINYLYQLQHKPISELSFVSTTDTLTSSPASADFEPSSPNLSDTDAVLATATETTLIGPALGPDLFVQAVFEAYSTFLTREVIDGPIGQRLAQSASTSSSIRRRPPGKLLIASALPPLVEDDYLHRIPEKYVERLEEDHVKAQKKFEGKEERISKTPWAGRGDWSYAGEDLDWTGSEEMGDDGDDIGLSGLSVTDGVGEERPVTPVSAASTRTSGTEFSSDASGLGSSVNTSITTPSSPPSAKSSPSTLSHDTKTPISTLLAHDPPLCDLKTRIRMTNQYNALLLAFCAQHPQIFEFIDISPSILANPKMGDGSADRTTWACPVDPTNIHPLWEPTLPLWLEELGKVGLGVEGWGRRIDEEESFREYEEDKRRRVEAMAFEESGAKVGSANASRRPSRG